MIYALYVIGSTAGLVLLAARLGAAQQELARVRGESDDRARAVADEYCACTQGVAMALACLIAGLAAASWHAPPRPAARPAGSGRAGAPEGAGAYGPGREAAG